MKYSQATNLLIRSKIAPLRAVSRRSSLLLASKLSTATLSPLSSRQSAPSSSPVAFLIGRPFSHSSVCQKKRGQVEGDESKRGKQGRRHRSDEVGEEDAEAEPAGKRGKKGAKDNNNNNNKGPSSSSAASSSHAADPNQPVPSPETPFEFADLTYAFDKAEKRYAEELRKLRAGGRFNADVIGAVPVTLDKNSRTSFPLRELATVAPLGGRRWSILAFEEDSVKHIQAAVQRSEHFNQQPQRSEDNPLELIMTVELERADTLAKHAKEICQNWRNKLRDEAHKRETLHKRWKADKLIVDDDLFKLKEKMKKLQDDKMKVIAAKEKEAVTQIMAKAS
ncbi:ribosome recycling factor domain-containing protein [Cladorrhinum samala]|uniref:Ribosome recycling factor domain-containing protein n=1 Tax=Cladorrhinum samala TaxID=585594 RepID=A0AAV9HCP0_9PEZI|nr:ribosome recycling factor domain-containing protein [Cladorrhinum samala]